jgi:hypothetical protein
MGRDAAAKSVPGRAGKVSTLEFLEIEEAFEFGAIKTCVRT